MVYFRPPKTLQVRNEMSHLPPSAKHGFLFYIIFHINHCLTWLSDSPDTSLSIKILNSLARLQLKIHTRLTDCIWPSGHLAIQFKTN